MKSRMFRAFWCACLVMSGTITAHAQAQPTEKVLRYGFEFRKSNVTESTVREPIDAVVARTKALVLNSRETGRAVIQGVDETWEVCLLKFTVDLIERSAGGNLGDFRRRGLL